MAKSTARTSNGQNARKEAAKNSQTAEPGEKDKAATKSRKPSMGRGLGAILGDPQPVPETGQAEATGIYEVPLDQIEANPFQPRANFAEENLEELAESIGEHGVIQPLLLRRVGPDAYQLIAGERRMRASRMAGLEKVPAFIREADNEQMLEFALIENIQRHDLNPMEVALGYKRLMDECDLTIEAVGKKVAKQRATVNNYLRLLRLPPEIQAAVRDKRITFGHARAMVNIEDPVHQLEMMNRVLEQGASVRTLEQWVAELNKPTAEKTQNGAPASLEEEKNQMAKDAYAIQLQALRRQLEDQLQTKVEFQQKGPERGELRIHYYSLDDLNKLLDLLRQAQAD